MELLAWEDCYWAAAYLTLLRKLAGRAIMSSTSRLVQQHRQAYKEDPY